MKFTLRDLFLVTMIVALAVGWLIEHRKRVELQIHASGLDKQVSEFRREDDELKRAFTRFFNSPKPPANRIDGELFKKLSDEAREKYGVP